MEPGPAERSVVVHDPQFEVSEAETCQRLRQRVRRCRCPVILRRRQSARIESTGQGVRGFVDDLVADMEAKLEFVLFDNLGGVVLNDSVVGEEPEQSGRAKRVAARQVRT